MTFRNPAKSPPAPLIAYDGALKVAGDVQAVTYCLRPAVRKPGAAAGASLKGSMTGEPSFMRAAFRAGETKLTLADGRIIRIKVIAHAEGSEVAYFEG